MGSSDVSLILCVNEVSPMSPEFLAKISLNSSTNALICPTSVSLKYSSSNCTCSLGGLFSLSSGLVNGFC